MNPDARSWKVFDAKTPILTYEYSFGVGTSNALAVGGKDGLILVSPPCRVGQSVFDDLARYGTVRALVASNAFHHLGLPAWKARFPNAAVFAPAQAVARVEKRTGLSGIRTLADAGSVTGPNLELVDMPHYKTGEVLVRIKTDRGDVWYVTDIIMNFPVLPKHPIAKVVFGLTGSGPGLKFNNVSPLFMVKDKQALRKWFADEFRKVPPRWLIPAHGSIVDFAADSSAHRSLFGTG